MFCQTNFAIAYFDVLSICQLCTYFPRYFPLCACRYSAKLCFFDALTLCNYLHISMYLPTLHIFAKIFVLSICQDISLAKLCRCFNSVLRDKFCNYMYFPFAKIFPLVCLQMLNCVDALTHVLSDKFANKHYHSVSHHSLACVSACNCRTIDPCVYHR